ncbi:MAG: pitrilysin family protein [Planctomycetota bacterium]
MAAERYNAAMDLRMEKDLSMPHVQTSVLPNGVVVLTEHMPMNRGVGVSVLVDAGPQDETSEQSGLAHLCEHAFFLGTRTRSEQDIAGLIDSAGGQLGGFTARDYTCLHATISSDYVTYAVDLLGEMLTNSDYSNERLEREIEVIGHEIDAHEDETESWLDGELKRKMWPGDPLGRPLLGTRESLSSINRDHVQAFLANHYTPDRVIVAAAGQIDHDDFVEQTHDALWQLEGKKKAREHGLAVPVGGAVVSSREQRMALTSLMIPAPVYTDPDRYALHILVTLLGGGMSSRLYRELRERHGLVYSVSAGLNAYGRGSVIAVEMATSPESVMPGLMHIFDQLVRLAFEDQPISEEELWKANMQVHGQAFLASDSLQTRVSRLATQQHYFGHPIDANEMLEAIDAVDIATVCHVAKRVIGSGLAETSIGVAGNLGESERAMLEGIADLRDCFASIKTQTT